MSHMANENLEPECNHTQLHFYTEARKAGDVAHLMVYRALASVSCTACSRRGGACLLFARILWKIEAEESETQGLPKTVSKTKQNKKENQKARILMIWAIFAVLF